MRGTLWLDHFVKDTGFAIRQLRKAPGFTAVAVLSLALGIGANTAIFTLIESSLLQPIAVKHADKLRLLTWHERVGGWVAPNLGYMSATFGSIYEQGETADGGIKHTDFSPPVYQNFVRNNTVFESLFSFKELGRVTAVADGTAEALRCFSVSGDFYRGLEVAPVIGRAIGPEHDTKTQSASVALISYEYWTRRFARSPAVIGKVITLNEVPVTIIGVNPEYFTGIEPGGNFEVWVPLSLSAAVIGRSFLDETRSWQIPIMGRLKPDVSDARAQGELDALFQAGVDANPGPIEPMLKDPAKRPRFVLESAARGVDYLNEIYGRLLLAVLALAALVLLIACANVANLLLVRSAVRQREISLRLALGAGRGRLARQLLAEGLLLASMAGVAGVVLGYWARNGIPALLATPWRPSPFDAAFDPKVLMLSIAVTFVTGILFSLAPVWQSRRVEVNDALKENGRGTGSLSKLRAGRLLAVLQVALSVLLLASAGLCVKTFANLRSAPLGFRPEGVMMFTLDPPRLRYPAGSTGPLLAQLRERLGAIPGVQSATFSGSRVGVVVDPDDQTPGENRYASASSVGSRFFETMGIPILHGRPIDDRDIPSGPRAVVVNEEFGRRFFKDQNPAGRNFRGSDKALYQIVGVCADWHADRLRDAVRPAFYTALVQEPRGADEVKDPSAVHRPSSPIDFELRLARSQPSALLEIAAQIRQTLGSIDSNLAVTDLRTGVEQIADGLAQERLMASLAAIFGGLALTLACVGIYGVMAYSAARRTSEIGIRMALGARPAGVAWMVLRETLALAGAGVAIGIPAVLALSPILDHVLAPAWSRSFAYGLKPDDPLTIAAAVMVLVTAGFAAGYLPARRAARVDPMTALRHD